MANRTEQNPPWGGQGTPSRAWEGARDGACDAGLFFGKDRLEEILHEVYAGPMAARVANMEARLSNVEIQLSEIKKSISNLHYWIIGAIFTCATLVIGFGTYQSSWFQHSLNTSLQQSQKALDKIDATLMRIDMDRERPEKGK